MRGVARQQGSGPIYRREDIEAKLNGAWGRSDWARSARRRGGGRRRRRCAWRAACHLANGPGARGVRGNGKLECQAASLGGPGGLDGRGWRPPYAGGGRLCRVRGQGRGGEVEIGTYLQFLKSEGPLGKLKFSNFFASQMKKY